MRRNIVGLFAVLFFSFGAAWADQLQSALNAQTSGDYSIALKQFMQLAVKGNAIAQFWVGFNYDTGRGVAPDPIKALVWYRKSAAQGHPLAQRNLGDYYSMGKEGP
jgi:TPR repeat protein